MRRPIIVLLALTAWACDEESSNDGTGDATSDAADSQSGGDSATDGPGDATGADVAADTTTGVDSSMDTVDLGPPEAEDASYTMVLGAQIDALLSDATDQGVSFEVVSTPTLGELLYVDATTGRFVYTSLEVGEDTFEFALLEDGTTVDSATITITTESFDFTGEWELVPDNYTCDPHTFTVTAAEDSWVVSPLVSDCVEDAAGINVASPTEPPEVTVESQRLAVRSCVTDIRDVYYCHAFAFWRTSSRGDFQSIETVAGSMHIENQDYVISGAVQGGVRRLDDVAERAQVASPMNPVTQLGAVSDDTPVQRAIALENRGSIAANLSEVRLPEGMTMEGGYPGEGGTCGATLEPFATCNVMVTVTPSEPESGESGSLPFSVTYNDALGYDVTRLSVAWVWITP